MQFFSLIGAGNNNKCCLWNKPWQSLCWRTGPWPVPWSRGAARSASGPKIYILYCRICNYTQLYFANSAEHNCVKMNLEIFPSFQMSSFYVSQLGMASFNSLSHPFPSIVYPCHKLTWLWLMWLLLDTSWWPYLGNVSKLQWWLSLLRILKLNFGHFEAEVWSRFWSWRLVEILKLIFYWHVTKFNRSYSCESNPWVWCAFGCAIIYFSLFTASFNAQGALSTAHHNIGDEEGSAAVLVRRVREPPHVAKTHLACPSNIWKRISHVFQRRLGHSWQLYPTDIAMQERRNSMGLLHCCLSSSTFATWKKSLLAVLSFISFYQCL